LAVLGYLAFGFVLPGEGVFAALRPGQTVATLGYLVGFVPAAVLVSFAARSAGRLAVGHTLVLALLGTVVIFLCGVSWLAMVTGSLERGVALGLVPFAGWALVKVAVVTGVVQVMGFVRPSRLPIA
jgi:biotin transport system substrate-specific component